MNHNNNNNNANNINNNNNNNININVNFNPVLWFNVGQYRSNIYINGFIQQEYFNSLKLINNHRCIFYFLSLIDVLLCMSLLIFYFYINNATGFYLLIVALSMNVAVCLFQNFFFLRKQNLETKSKVLYSLIYLMISVLQVDLLTFQSFCQVEQKLRKDNDRQELVLSKYFNCLVGKFQSKIFFVFLRSLVINIVLILEDNVDYNFYIMIAFLVVNSIEYMVINYISLSLFYFTKKQSIAGIILTFIELTIELIQSYNNIYLFCIQPYIQCVLIIILGIYLVQQQVIRQNYYKFIFNPINVSFISLVFMGNKLSYLSSIYNEDINQMEALFSYRKNLSEFILYQLHFIGVSAITLYYNTDYFPLTLIMIQIVMIIFTIIFMIIKFFLMKRAQHQIKLYTLSSVEELKHQNLSAKCKLSIGISQKLQERDWLNFEKIIQNISPQFLCIGFERQFQIEYFHGYCRMTIFDLEAAEISNCFGYFLQKSKRISIEIEQAEQKLITFPICNMILSCLKKITILDQKKIDFKNSDLTQLLKDQEYSKQLDGILQAFDIKNICLSLLTFQKEVAEYQIINPTLIFYELYEYDQCKI